MVSTSFRGYPFTTPAPIAVRWKLSAAGTPLAIDIDEIKKWLNRPVEDTYFDAEIEGLALAAQRVIERHCQMLFSFSTWVGTVPILSDYVRVVRRPFVDVTGIQYVATDGTITTMPTTLYHALPVLQDIGQIALADGEAWPDLAHRMDAVRITARAGYAVTEADVTAGAPELPDDLRRALLMTIASMDSSHGDDAGGSSSTTVFAMKQAQGAGTIPQSAKMLLAPYLYHTITVT